MGLDQQRYPAACGSMSFRRLLQRVDRWDYSLSSNQHSSEVWESAYPSSYQQLASGYPRNDRYFTATPEDIERIRTGLGIEPGRTTVLYAPTSRDYRKGFVPRLDLARLGRELAPDTVLLVRAHYSYGARPELQQFQERGLLIDVSRHPSVEELCLAADALVTDYSSIMFDYANLDRPIVVFADDWEVYRAARGVYFDLLSGRPGETPGAVARTEDELVEIFRAGRWNDAAAAGLRAAFRARFCQFDDGRAAERVVRRFFLGAEQPAQSIPLARTPAGQPGQPPHSPQTAPTHPSQTAHTADSAPETRR
jgi:CDP-glycerol glycerophosphotransferase